MAIKTDDSLWAWGDNGYGQLGDGTNTTNPTPIKIMDGVVAVSASMWRTMAVKLDGSLWAWGYNGNGGQLGDGTTTFLYAPTKIMDGVTFVSTGAWHTKS